MTFSADPKASPADIILFDFEETTAAADWTNLVLPSAKSKDNSVGLKMCFEAEFR